MCVTALMITASLTVLKHRVVTLRYFTSLLTNETVRRGSPNCCDPTMAHFLFTKVDNITMKIFEALNNGI